MCVCARLKINDSEGHITYSHYKPAERYQIVGRAPADRYYSTNQTGINDRLWGWGVVGVEVGGR